MRDEIHISAELAADIIELRKITWREYLKKAERKRLER